MLEHSRVVILQDAAEMLIAGRTHYLFLHEVFSCQLLKEFVKVMTIALGTVVEEEKSSEVFEEALDNKINTCHHTLDAGLKKMTSHIDSTKMTSRIQHKSVMQELNVLVTKCDIQKATNAMLPAKKHKTGRGETRRIHPRTICLHGLHTDTKATCIKTNQSTITLRCAPPWWTFKQKVLSLDVATGDCILRPYVATGDCILRPLGKWLKRPLQTWRNR
jgi:hypothetical protein